MNVINFPTVNVAFAEACKARSAESERVTKLEHENFDIRTALADAVLAGVTARESVAVYRQQPPLW
ncbi:MULTISPECIES: hypothetical protein [Bradyrhizobium]|uniref:Uncharacterized protein n=1 Tax=Bradyrhizobium retamae TaxID=1300035 RepID=A0A0R3MH45_9BRAD|nr:hypothetical protein [Bradyrhizobium retamae]KRR16595.1 hypothetical protein CQ13_36610 [Bradyrhizobium retamae]